MKATESSQILLGLGLPDRPCKSARTRCANGGISYGGVN
jgi:hypothetical protein